MYKLSASYSSTNQGTAKGTTGGGNVFNAGSVFGNTNNSGQGGGAGGGAGTGSGVSSNTVLYIGLAAAAAVLGFFLLKK